MRSAAKFLSVVTALIAAAPTQCAFASPANASAGKTKNHQSVHSASSKQQAAKDDLVWHSVTKGFALAKKKHKPILVDFYTDWCHWCKVMDEKTFHDVAVKKVLASRFILVRANAEDGADGQRLSKTLEVRGYPTTVLCDSTGSPKAAMVGFVKADKFAGRLDEFLTGKATTAGAATAE